MIKNIIGIMFSWDPTSILLASHVDVTADSNLGNGVYYFCPAILNNGHYRIGFVHYKQDRLLVFPIVDFISNGKDPASWRVNVISHGV